MPGTAGGLASGLAAALVNEAVVENQIVETGEVPHWGGVRIE